jgi:hypothetical protein
MSVEVCCGAAFCIYRFISNARRAIRRSDPIPSNRQALHDIICPNGDANPNILLTAKTRRVSQVPLCVEMTSVDQCAKPHILVCATVRDRTFPRRRGCLSWAKIGQSAAVASVLHAGMTIATPGESAHCVSMRVKRRLLFCCEWLYRAYSYATRLRKTHALDRRHRAAR